MEVNWTKMTNASGKPRFKAVMDNDGKIKNFKKIRKEKMSDFNEEKVYIKNGIYYQLRDCMSYVAELLGTTPDNIDVYYHSYISYTKKNTFEVDSEAEGRVISNHGFSKEIVPVLSQSDEFTYGGMTLCECQSHPKQEIQKLLNKNEKGEWTENDQLVDVSKFLNEKWYWKKEGILCKKAYAEGIRYVYAKDNLSEEDYFTFLFVKKGDYWKIKRHKNAYTKAMVDIKIPTLPTELIQEILNNSINFLRKKKAIKNYNVNVKRGLLFDGPPGNGKTMMCRYIQDLATIHNIPFSTVTSSRLDRGYSQNELVEIFNQEGIIFFDDIDISYLNRKSGNGSMACSILSAMDGLTKSTNRVCIFTTNERIEDLDEAFTRPGRIDCIFTFEKPDTGLRTKFIETWSKDILDNINKDLLVKETNGCSFAEIEAIKNILATNYLFSNKWDLQKAFDDFGNNRENFGKKHIGF